MLADPPAARAGRCQWWTGAASATNRVIVAALCLLSALGVVQGNLFSPQDVPGPPDEVLVSNDNASALRFQFFSPENVKAEGVNGAPILGYKVEIAQRVDEVQTFTVASTGPVLAGTYKMSFSNAFATASTACISWNASVLEFQLALEELPNIDGVTVTRSAYGVVKNGYTYAITFNGEYLVRGPQPNVLEGNQVGCVPTQPANRVMTFIGERITAGVASFYPEVWEIISQESSGSKGLSGSFDLSIGFEGEWIDSGVTATIQPGSKSATTPPSMMGKVNRGDAVKIGDETFVVHSSAPFTDTILPLDSYHVHGTTNAPIYILDTALGDVAVTSQSPNVQTYTDFTSQVSMGEFVKIGMWEFQIAAIPTPTLLTLDRGWPGATARHITAHKKKKVTVSAAVDAADMASALNALPGMGSVAVSRVGPTRENGYRWIVTFLSLGSKSNCPASPCLSADKVTGNQEWLRDSYGQTCATCTVSATIVEDETMKFLLVGVTGDYTPDSVIVSKETNGGVYEIQAIAVVAAQDDLSGSFAVNFQNTFQEYPGVIIYHDDTAADVQTKLQSLPAVGRVNVTQSSSALFFGTTWTVTFVSNIGDLPLFLIDDSSLIGTNAEVQVTELMKGADIDFEVAIDGLNPSQEYYAHAFARNTNGYGSSTSSIQWEGKGVLPLVSTASSYPSPPTIVSTLPISETQIQIGFADPDTHGESITRYILEYAVGDTFGAPAVQKVFAFNQLENDISGTFQLTYASEMTVKLPIEVSAQSFEDALMRLSSVRRVSVSRALYVMTGETGNEVTAFSAVTNVLTTSAPLKPFQRSLLTAGAQIDVGGNSFAVQTQPIDGSSTITVQAGHGVADFNGMSFALLKIDASGSEHGPYGYEWTITFLEDAEHELSPIVSSLALSSSLRSVEAGSVLLNVGITNVASATPPDHFGFFDVSNDPITCDSYVIGAPSAIQVIQFFASTTITDGSFTLQLGDQVTSCITIGTANGKSDMKTALEALVYVKRATVEEQRNFKVILLPGSAQSKISGFDSVALQVSIVSSGTNNGLTLAEADALPAGAIFRASRNPNDFSRDSCEFTVASDAAAGDLVVEVLNTENCASFTDIRTLQILDLHDYKVRLWGRHPSGEWPTLQITPDGNQCDAAWTPPTTNPVYGSVHTVRYEGMCATGQRGTQTILAEAASAIGGTFVLSYRGQETPALAFQGTTAAVLRDALDGITSPGAVNVSLSQYGTYGRAWHITFMSERDQEDVIFIKHSRLTGQNVAISVFDTVKVFTDADQDDLRGSFQIAFNGETTESISVSATHKKVTQELQKLLSIDSVLAVGEAINGDIGAFSLELTAFATQNTAVLTQVELDGRIIDPTMHLAVREKLFIAGATFWIQSLTPTDITLSSTYTGATGLVDVSAGLITKQTKALPGKIGISPQIRVITATPTLRTIEFPENHGFVPRSFFYLSGNKYTVVTVIGSTVTTDRAYTGVTISSATPAAYVFDNRLRTTRDWTNLVSVGDYLWIRSNSVDMVRYTVMIVDSRFVEVSGLFTSDILGGVAYHASNGRQWNLVFRSYQGSLNSLDIIPGNTFRGTNARIGLRDSGSISPRTLSIGNPKSTQTVMLESLSSSDVGGAHYTLSFNGDETTQLVWAATADLIQASLEALDSVDGVTVESKAYGNGYVHTISFWGIYTTRKLPLLVATVTGAAVPANVGIRVAGNGAVATSRQDNLILNDDFGFRIFALNRRGTSKSPQVFAAQPWSVSVVPTPPTGVVLGEFHGPTWLSVNYRPPQYTGGSEVTMYRLEWDSSPSFDSTSRDYGVTTIQKRYEVQYVTTSFRSAYGAGGTFTLSWGGRSTPPLPFDCSADVMMDALSIITDTANIAIDPVKVRRVQASWGYTWRITFQNNPGNLAALIANGERLTGDFPLINVEEIVDGFSDLAIGDFMREVQDVYSDSMSQLSGSFKLEFEGKVTASISVSASGLEVQSALQAITNLYSIKVSKVWRNEVMNNAIWSVTFAYLQGEELVGAGNVFLMEVVDSTQLSGTAATVTVASKVSGTDPFRYSITGLRPGVQYFLHAMAYNEDGFGSATSPMSSATTCGQPDPPSSVTAAVKDGTTLSVSWGTSSFDGGCPVSKYKVEWFRNPGSFQEQTVTISAGKGLPEIQRLVNFADSPSLSGYFKLSFQGETTENIAFNAQETGPNSVKERLERLSSIGTVEVSRETSTRVVDGLVVTTNSASRTIRRDSSSTVTLDQTGLGIGMTVWIAGIELQIVTIGLASFTVNTAITLDIPVPVFTTAHGYSWTITFLSGHVGTQPLIKVSTSDSWGGDNPGIYVASVQKGLQPISGTFRLSFASGGLSDTTPPLMHNSSASELKIALESLVTIGNVNVTRAVNGYGYNWIVTFLTEFVNDVSLLAVDGTELHGPSVRVSVARTYAGVQPTQYCENNGIIGLPLEVGIPGALQADITGLVTGVKYGVRVRAYNREGYGGAHYISPAFQVPRTIPSPPNDVKLVVLSSQLIKVRWSKPTSDGGSAVASYRVQWDTSSSFASAASPNYDQQRTLSAEGDNVGPFFVNIPALTRTSYFVRVFAVNDQGASEASRPNPISVIPFDQTPGKVESATATVLSSYAILVEWQASSVEKTYFGGDGGLSITQYMIEWDSSSTFDSPAAFGLVQGSVRSYVIGGDDPLTGVRSDVLTPETVYYIRITAFNAKGAGSPCATSPKTVLVTNQPPTAPQDLTMSIISSTSVKAEWKNPQFDGGSSLKAYQLEWDEQADFASGESASTTIPIIREMQSIMLRSDVVNEEQFIEATVEVINEEQMVRTQFTGVDEVQLIQTTNDQVVDEVIAITTSANDINEIQQLRLDADDINEIQAVRTTTPEVLEVQSVQVGASRINEVQTITLVFPGVGTDPSVIGGTFTVSFDSRVCTYCTLTKTFERSADLLASLKDSDPTNGASKMKTILDALSNIDTVTVTRSDTVVNTDLTYVYSITFSGDAVAGDVLSLTIDSSLTKTISGVTSTIGGIPTTATEATKGNEVSYTANSVFSLTYTCESYSGPAESTGVSAECTPAVADRLCSACVTAFDATTGTFTVNTDLRAQLPLLTGYKLMVGACSFEAGNLPITATTITVASGDVGTLCSSFSGQTLALFKAKQFVASIPLKSSATQPLVASSVENLLNAIINSVTVTATARITDSFVGTVYTVTFRKRSGTLPLMQCGTSSIGITNSGGSSSCSVSRTTIGSTISGSFTLALTLESNPAAAAILTAAIPWDASEAQMKSTLEAVVSNGEQVFGAVTVRRSVYSETANKWSGGFTWQIEFTSRRANIPRMTSDATNLVDADPATTTSQASPSVAVEDYLNPLNPSAGSRDGNQVGGTMTFAFKGVTSQIVYTIGAASIDPTTLSTSGPDAYFQQFLIDNLGIPSIIVTRSAATQARGFTWTIEFTDQTTGGDVELLQLPVTALTGTNVRAVVVETRKGNQLGGTFQLTFNGDSTGPILFSADKAAVQAQLNSLSSIKPSSVLVDRVGPLDTANLQVKSYRWLITFYSSVWADPTSDHSNGIAGNWKGARAKWDDVWPETGYSKTWGRHVGPMAASGFVFECVKDGLTTTANDNSQTCLPTIVQSGVGPIMGTFTVTLDTTGLAPRMSVARSVTSIPIAHNAWATRTESGATGTSVEEILEKMANVGDVAVSRSAVNPMTGGYSWSVTFLRDVYGPCEEVEYSSTGDRLCNSPGNVPQMTTTTTGLDGSHPTAVVSTTQNGQILRGDFTAFSIQSDPGWVGQFFLLPNCDLASSTSVCNNIQSMAIDPNSASGLASYLSRNDRFTLAGYPSCIFQVASTVTAATVAVTTTSCAGMNPTGLTSMGMNIVLPWNAAADAVVRTLQGSYIGRKVSVERTVQGKYGEMSWLVHFISNPGSTPLGAGNLPDIQVSLSPAATTTAAVGVSVTEVTAGSRGLSGSFLVDFHSTIGPRQVTFDEDPERLERKINEMNTIGRVTVDRFEYPSSATGCSDSTCSGGWDDRPVDAPGTRGGYRWRIRFMKVTGEYGGLTFPSGSGNVGPLSVTLSTLQGSQRSVNVVTSKAGSNPVTGSFMLNTTSQTTPPLQYSSSANAIKQGIESMQLYGKVDVTQSYLLTQQIPDAVAMVTKDGTSAAITGVSDISQFVAPGDVFRVGYVGANTLVGSNGDWPFTKDVATSRVTVSVLSPVVKTATPAVTEVLYPDMMLRIDGLVYKIKHSGQEIQRVTVAATTWTAVQTADIFSLSLTRSGAMAQTTCLAFNADASDVKSALNAAIPGANVKVVQQGPKTDANGNKGYQYTVYFRGATVSGDVGTLQFVVGGACGGTMPNNAAVTGTVEVIKHGGEIAQHTLTLTTNSGHVIDSTGYFKLQRAGSSTDCLRWGITANDLELQLEDAQKLATGDVVVTRQGSGESITEIQRLRMTSSSEVTSGNTGLFQLMFSVDGETMTTNCLSYGISAEDLQAALNGLGAFGDPGDHINVTRTGDGTASWGFGYEYLVNFRGPISGGYSRVLGDMQPLVVINVGETPCAPVVGGNPALIVETVRGGAAGYKYDIYFLDYPSAVVPLLTLLDERTSLCGRDWVHDGGSVRKAMIESVVLGGSAEIQELTIRNAESQVPAPTFKLSFMGQSTICLAITSTAAEIQAKLNGLSTIGVGGVLVSRDVQPVAAPGGFIYKIAFVGDVVTGDVPPLQIDYTGCVSLTGTSEIFVETPVHGGQPPGAFALTEYYDGESPGIHVAYAVSQLFSVMQEQFEIQQVAVVNSGNDITPLTGTYVLAYGATQSQPIAWDASEVTMEAKLIDLLRRSAVATTSGEVIVTRRVDAAAAPNGHLYTIYFSGNGVSGNLPQLTVVANGYFAFGTASVVASTLREGVNGALTLQKQLLPFASETSPTVPAMYLSDDDTLSVFKVNGFLWTIKFASTIGDVPALGMNTQGLVGNLVVMDNFIRGSASNSYIITSLLPGISYYAHVAASTDIGQGSFSMPAASVTPSSAASAAQNTVAGYALYVPEVQEVRLAATHITEIQEIATSAASIPEVQTLRTFAAPDTCFSSNCVGGNFAFRVPTIQTITISSLARITAGEFSLRFRRYVEDGTTPGTFAPFTTAGVFETSKLSYMSTASEVELALLQLDALEPGDISVTRDGDGTADYDYGYIYSITFVGNSVAGETEQMEAHTLGHGCPGCAAFVTGGVDFSITVDMNKGVAMGTDTAVQEVIVSASKTLMTGSYQLSFDHLSGTQTTACISFDAPARSPSGTDPRAMESILMAMDNIDKVFVTRSVDAVRAPNGYVYRIFFFGNGVYGKVNKMEAIMTPAAQTCTPFQTLENNALTEIGVSGAVDVEFVDQGGFEVGNTFVEAASATAEQLAIDLDRLPVFGNVLVTQSLVDEQGGYMWTIAFKDSEGNLPLFICAVDSIFTSFAGSGCETETLTDGNTLSGSFVVEASTPIAFDASAADMKLALEAMDWVGSVQVMRSEPSAQLGYVWTITFLEFVGDVPPLLITSSLVGTGCNVVVTEIRKGNAIGGSFTLSYLNSVTTSIQWNAPAKVSDSGGDGSSMQEKLEALAVVGALDVVRSVADSEGGYKWAITFLDNALNPGDLPLLIANASMLTGEGVVAFTREIVKGSNAVGDQLWLSFDPPVTDNGSPITKYRVRWDSSSTFAASPREYFLSDPAVLYQTQHITTSAPSLAWSAIMAPIVPEIQQLTIPDTMHVGDTFTLSFRGISTTTLTVGTTTMASLQAALSSLASVGAVSVSPALPAGPTTMSLSSSFLITFTQIQGLLPLLSPSDPAVTVARSQAGATNFRKKVVVFTCTSAALGTDELDFSSVAASTPVLAGATLATLEASLIALFETESGGIAVTTSSVSQTTLCAATTPAEITITFHQVHGDVVFTVAPSTGSGATVANVATKSIDGVYNTQPDAKMSGTFQIGYDGEYTRSLNAESTEYQVRYALEDLSTVQTAGVTREPSFQPLPGLVDVVNGQIYVACSTGETCVFSSGVYGLPGDLIRVGGEWYTVRADDVSSALHASRLYLGDLNGHETGYRGSSESRVRINEWAKGYVWTVTMLRLPSNSALTYLRAKVPRLYPLDASVRITGSSCSKCYYLPTGTVSRLIMGQQYYIQVDAYNAHGKGETATPLASATPSQVPNAPSNVDLAVVSGTQLEVFFSPPALATTNVSPNFNNDISAYIVQWDVVSVFKHGLPICSSCAVTLSDSNVLSTSVGSLVSTRMTVGTRFTVADDTCVLEVAQAVVGLTVTVTPGHGCASFSGKAYALYYYTFAPSVISGSLLAGSPPYRYLITGLSTTITYYVRVAAINSVPVQKIALDGNPPDNRKWSYPLSATTRDKVPDPPISVALVPFSGTSLQVHIQPPTRDGQGLDGAAVSHYWIDVDTVSTFDSATKSVPLEVAAGDIPALIANSASTRIYTLAGLANGVRYFVQVKAKNSIGYSRATLAPNPLAPTRSPDAPVNVKVSTVTVSTVPIQKATVTWQRPVSNGGLPLTSYKVEWWRGTASQPEVQLIELKWSSAPTDAKFRLSFGGRQTGDLPHNVAPENLRSALMNIIVNGVQVVGHVQVSRSTVSTNLGYQWSVTFASATVNPGDQPMIRFHLGTVNGGADVTGSVTEVVPGVMVPPEANFPGSREIQVLVVSASGVTPVGGFFRFSFKGSAWSSYIPVTASAEVLQQCLKQLPTLGQVSVAVPLTAGLNPTNGRVWTITFDSVVGNAPALTVDASKVTPATAFVGIKDGDNAVNGEGVPCYPGDDAVFCTGRTWTGYTGEVATTASIGERAVEYGFYETIDSNTLTYTITGLTPGETYFVAVTAKNALGLGVRARSSPSSVVPPVQVPQLPTNVAVDVNFGVATQLKAYWDSPTSDGGASVWMYRVEYDPSPLFKNRGMQDVWCPTSPTLAVWRVRTYRSAAGDPIASGFFNLKLTRRNLVLTSEPIPWNAVATSDQEIGGDPTTTDVFCTPCTGCSDVCDSQATFSPRRRELSGSVQSKLEYFSTLSNGVKVARTATADTDGGYTWTITFQDTGDDFNLQADTSNYLSCAAGTTPSLSTCNGATYTVVTTKLTAGISNPACSSVGQVIPSVGALNKGQLYYVRVFAYNKVGFSLPALAASPQKPMVVPGAPTGVTLQVASVSELVVLLNPPDDNGGDAIVAYQVQWALDAAFSVGTGTQLVTLLSGGAPYSTVIGGLVKGTPYYVRVRARNSQGFGTYQPSSPASLNPHTTPGAPTRVTLGVTTSTMLTVQWSVPSDDGGDALTGFVVQWDVSASFDSLSVDSTAARITDVTQRSYTITLLTSGTSYYVRVLAVNRAGSGTPQTATPASLVPVNTRPGKPHTLAAQSSNAGELAISWQLPRVPAHLMPCSGSLIIPQSCPVFGSVDVVFGGSPFESYLVQWARSSDFSGYDWRSVVTTSALVSGLDSGATYFVRVMAVNSEGLKSDFCARANSGGYLCPDRLVLLNDDIVTGDFVSVVIS